MSGIYPPPPLCPARQRSLRRDPGKPSNPVGSIRTDTRAREDRGFEVLLALTIYNRYYGTPKFVLDQ